MNSVEMLRSYFIQAMIMQGKLYCVDKLFKIILKNLYLMTRLNGLEIMQLAIYNSCIFFGLKRFYLGGMVYFIPVILTNNHEEKKAIKCLLKYSKKRKQSILVGLLSELYLAKDSKGDTIKYKNDFHLKVIKGIPYLRFLRKRIKK